MFSRKTLQTYVIKLNAKVTSELHAKATKTPPKIISRKALGQWLTHSTQKSQNYLQKCFRAKRWRLRYQSQRQGPTPQIFSRTALGL